MRHWMTNEERGRSEEWQLSVPELQDTNMELSGEKAERISLEQITKCQVELFRINLLDREFSFLQNGDDHTSSLGLS